MLGAPFSFIVGPFVCDGVHILFIFIISLNILHFLDSF